MLKTGDPGPEHFISEASAGVMEESKSLDEDKHRIEIPDGGIEAWSTLIGA